MWETCEPHNTQKITPDSSTMRHHEAPWGCQGSETRAESLYPQALASKSWSLKTMNTPSVAMAHGSPMALPWLPTCGTPHMATWHLPAKVRRNPRAQWIGAPGYKDFATRSSLRSRDAVLWKNHLWQPVWHNLTHLETPNPRAIWWFVMIRVTLFWTFWFFDHIWPFNFGNKSLNPADSWGAMRQRSCMHIQQLS